MGKSVHDPALTDLRPAAAYGLPPEGPRPGSLTRPPADVIVRARGQFVADFPELSAHRAANPAEKWVAYHGPVRVGYGTSKAGLVRACLDRGLPAGGFLVLGIDPAVADPDG